MGMPLVGFTYAWTWKLNRFSHRWGWNWWCSPMYGSSTEVEMAWAHPCMGLKIAFIWWLAHMISLPKDQTWWEWWGLILLGLDGHFSLHGSHLSFSHPIARHSWPHPKQTNSIFNMWLEMAEAFQLFSDRVSDPCLDRQTPRAVIVRPQAKPRTLYFESHRLSSLITANARPGWQPMMHPHAGSTMAFLSTNLRQYQTCKYTNRSMESI